MNNTYWLNNGKYQKEYDKISELIPPEGFTDNKYINLLIAISKLYYRHFNDGDNLEHFENLIKKYVLPFEKD